MSELPEIFNNGTVYFSEKSIFNLCTHSLEDGDVKGKITLRMDKGIVNLREAMDHLGPLLSDNLTEDAITFLPANRIPGRDNNSGKNYYKLTVEGEVVELAKLVVGLGGIKEREYVHAQNLGDRTGAARGATS